MRPEQRRLPVRDHGGRNGERGGRPVPGFACSTRHYRTRTGLRSRWADRLELWWHQPRSGSGLLGADRSRDGVDQRHAEGARLRVDTAGHLRRCVRVGTGLQRIERLYHSDKQRRLRCSSEYCALRGKSGYGRGYRPEHPLAIAVSEGVSQGAGSTAGSAFSRPIGLRLRSYPKLLRGNRTARLYPTTQKPRWRAERRAHGAGVKGRTGRGYEDGSHRGDHHARWRAAHDPSGRTGSCNSTALFNPQFCGPNTGSIFMKRSAARSLLNRVKYSPPRIRFFRELQNLRTQALPCSAGHSPRTPPASGGRGCRSAASQNPCSFSSGEGVQGPKC